MPEGGTVPWGAGRYRQPAPFPPAVMAEVGDLWASVASDAVAGTDPEVLVRGDSVRFPARIYRSPSGDTASSLVRTLAAACLGTRHHDGFVRQRELRAVLQHPRPWSAPYVVRLLGEHVVEIVEDVAVAIDEPELGAACREFARENPAATDLVRARVASYWSCYHRGRYPELRDHPGARAVALLGAGR